MNSEVVEIRQEAHASIEKLSDAQIAVIGQALKGLVGLSAEANKPPAVPVPDPSVDVEPLPGDVYKELEQRLEGALQAEDLLQTRACISSCLEAIRSGVAASASGLPLPRSPRPVTEDATTGLPARLILERTVANAITEGKESMVALFVVERLAYINKRFGRITGDEILLYVAQYLAQELSDSSSLCRWSGPAFGVVLNSYNAARKTEMQIRAISRKQLSKTIDSGGRSVMLPISCSCMVETLSPDSSPELIFTKMDDFISSHVND